MFCYHIDYYPLSHDQLSCGPAGLHVFLVLLIEYAGGLY